MAKKVYEQLQKDYNRYSNLADVDAVTRQQLEQLRLQLEGAQTKMNSLEKRLNDFVIKAPVSGTINQLFVSKGNTTGPGTPICEIIGGITVKIEAKINPEDAAALQPGLPATLSDEFGHGETYAAQLSEIGERAGKFGGVSAIFTLLATENKSPQTGSIVDIQVQIPGGTSLLVPRQALTNKNGKMGLFVMKSNSTVEFTPVKYIDFDDESICLIGQELKNSTIVTEGNYLLKTGDLIKIMNKPEMNR
jgi:RND family efflux transporter MFP subunit